MKKQPIEAKYRSQKGLKITMGADSGSTSEKALEYIIICRNGQDIGVISKDKILSPGPTDENGNYEIPKEDNEDMRHFDRYVPVFWLLEISGHNTSACYSGSHSRPFPVGYWIDSC
jgi:hypothetical protein